MLEWMKGREPVCARFSLLARQALDGMVLLHMSRINYGETVYSIRKALDLPDSAHALRLLSLAPIHVHSVDDLLVDQAVELKSRYPISYADAFAAALAIRLDAPLVTGDTDFQVLEAEQRLRLRWIGV